VKYSQEKLANRVDDLNCIKGTQRQPSDATWKYNKATKTFECVPEDYGTAVIRNEVCRAVEVCVQTMQKELNIANDNRYYNNPSILSDDEKLNHAIEEGNALLAGTVTYTLHDGIVQVDEDVIQKWVKINVKNGTATLKRDKVKKFVQQMAAKHDTLGTPYKFKTQRGDTVEVSGFYGWKINKDKEVELLIKDVKKGKHVDREPEYAYRGEGGADNPFGNTYAEVDLTNQRMYLVKNGKPKMSSDIVTGNVSHGAGTPTGIYRISYKDPDAVLRGPRLSNGEYSYESHVSYWMPFNGGIGFHDATWRSSFGGSIYRSNGSHGCVNMPYSKAKELFDYVYAGMVVIVYN
jgi:lipoprotein-anchoring transpeptidase ErfK/SrfK